MSRILIVDDCPDTGRMVGAMLRRANANWTTDYASNGTEALSKLSRTPFDLVLTDLLMPEMDGFDLMDEIHDLVPETPVVVLTAAGDEESAVRALKSGAAHYLTKCSLPARIVDTVSSVLASGRLRKQSQRLLTFIEQSRTEFECDTDWNLIPAIQSRVVETMKLFGFREDQHRFMRISLALEEALANAIFHGNLEISSELKSEDDSRFYELARERLCQEPYCHRRIRITEEFDQHRACITIADEGHGFDRSKVADPAAEENLDKPSGRGLTLMKSFMDDVYFNDCGNSVTLVKYKSPGPPDVEYDTPASGGEQQQVVSRSSN